MTVPIGKSSVHVTLVPRSTDGWIRELLQTGLAHAEASSSLTEPQWEMQGRGGYCVVVRCDASYRDEPSTEAGHVTTWPCAQKRCLAPAARGCLHCSKHGGHGAQRLVQRTVELLNAAECAPVRRIVFVATSTAVCDAYRRALVNAARLGHRRAQATSLLASHSDRERDPCKYACKTQPQETHTVTSS